MDIQQLKEQIAKWFYNKAFHDPLDFTWEEATELVPDDRVLTVLRIENVKKFRQDAANILSLLDSLDSPYILKSEVVKRIREIKNPFEVAYNINACRTYLDMKTGFNSAIQKAVELFEVKK